MLPLPRSPVVFVRLTDTYPGRKKCWMFRGNIKNLYSVRLKGGWIITLMMFPKPTRNFFFWTNYETTQITENLSCKEQFLIFSCPLHSELTIKNLQINTLNTKISSFLWIIVFLRRWKSLTVSPQPSPLIPTSQRDVTPAGNMTFALDKCHFFLVSALQECSGDSRAEYQTKPLMSPSLCQSAWWVAGRRMGGQGSIPTPNLPPHPPTHPSPYPHHPPPAHSVQHPSDYELIFLSL